MNEYSAGKNRIFILVLLLGLSVAVMTVDSITEQGIRPGYESYLSFFSYPQRAVLSSWRTVRDFLTGVFAQRHLVERNRELKFQLDVLEERIAELESYRRENEQLRRLLDFREKSGIDAVLGDSIGAEIIGRNPLNWYRSVMIDRGAGDGVRKGMVVVGGGGLAGRVVEGSSSASIVMLILDEESRVSAVVERTGEHGIITGRGDGLLTMKYLSDKSDIQPGDTVRTSGMGGVFSKGLAVGSVSSVKMTDYGLTVSAEIIPSVDFSRLETVLVLRN